MARVPLVSRRSIFAVIVALVLGLGVTTQTTSASRQTTGTKPATPSASAPQATQPPASTPAAPQFVLLTIVDVKPDMMADYVALQKSEMIPALQKGGIMWRDAWRSAGFGRNYMVAYVAPLASFAALDGPGPIVKALGEEGAKTFGEKMNKLITGSRRYALRSRPDLGFKGEEGAPMAKLGVLAEVEVVAGRQPEFENILKMEWGPALKKGGVPLYSVSEVVFGGPIGMYYTFTPLENFAQLDKGHPIAKSIGEAGVNKLMTKMGPSIRHAERFVIRYDDDLSFRTKATSQLR